MVAPKRAMKSRERKSIIREIASVIHVVNSQRAHVHVRDVRILCDAGCDISTSMERREHDY